MNDEFEDYKFAAGQDSGQNGAKEMLIPADLLQNTLARLGLEDDTGKQKILEHFYQDLYHPQWQVRLAAVRDLERQSKRLLIALSRDEERMVRTAAIQALGHTDEDVSNTLQSALHDPAWEVRAAAITALGERSVETSVDAILSMTKDEDSSVRTVALQMLGLLGDNVPLHIFQNALHDPSWEVRTAAVFSLGKRDVPEPKKSLHIALKDEELVVRQAAQEVVQALSTNSEKKKGQIMFTTLRKNLDFPKEPRTTMTAATHKKRPRYGVALLLVVTLLATVYTVIPLVYPQLSLGPVRVGGFSFAFGDTGTYKHFVIEGASMEPTLTNHATVVVDTSVYSHQKPTRNDIVAFTLPNQPQYVYFKRIIAIPGDVITVDNTTIILNGKALNEPYVLPKNQGNPFSPGSHRTFTNYKIPPDQFFVLGDNRKGSDDSRDFGMVSLQDIIGHVLVPLK